MRAIGVDVGGSGVRVRLVDGEWEGTARRSAGLPRAGGRIAVEPLARLIAGCVLDAAPGRPRSPDADADTVVCIGMSGLPDILDQPGNLAVAVGTLIGAGRVILASDALSSHAGALGLESGTVIAAGTGVVALGSDLQTVWNRSDGWGMLLGDDGGGAWVGQRGLRAALRGADGRRGGSTALLDRMHARFGGTAALVDAVYAEAIPSFLIAGFAPDVASAARDGDAVALRIWDEAGRHLAEAAVAASTGLPPRFSWAGSLFDVGELLGAPFTRELIALCPDATVTAPLADSAGGALLLAQRSASSGPQRNGIAEGTPHALYVGVQAQRARTLPRSAPIASAWPIST